MPRHGNELNELGMKMTSTALEEDVSSTTGTFTYMDSLKIGKYRGGFWANLKALALVTRFPGVWVVTLQYASLVAGVVTISTIGSQLLSAPPYLWGQNAGLINVGGIIGTAIGGVWTYIASDRVLEKEAANKRNSSGYAEPESRLKIQIPALTIGTFGLWIFGACAANPGPKRWVGLEFGYGMLSLALMQAPSVGFNYVSSVHLFYSEIGSPPSSLLKHTMQSRATAWSSSWWSEASSVLPGHFSSAIGYMTGVQWSLSVFLGCLWAFLLS